MTFDNVNTQVNDVKDNTATAFHQNLPPLDFSQGNTLKFDQKEGNSALVSSGVLPSFDLHDDAVGGNGKGSAKDLTWANFEGAALITEKPAAAGQDGAPKGTDAAAGQDGAPKGTDAAAGQDGAPKGTDAAAASQGGSTVWSQFEGARLITDPPAPQAQVPGGHDTPSSAGGSGEKSDSASKDAGAGRPPSVWDTFEGQTLVTDQPHDASQEKTGGPEKTTAQPSVWDTFEGFSLVTDGPNTGGPEKTAAPEKAASPEKTASAPSVWDVFEGQTLVTDPPVVQPDNLFRGKQ